METSRMTIPSEKGGIAAIAHRPDNQTDKLAIICPGYLDTKDYKHLVALADKLASLGYVTVRFDPTGTWESFGEIPDYTTSRYIQDVRDIADFMLVQHPYKTILLCGHSLGASVAILCAAQDPRITEVVSIMPPIGWALDKVARERWEKDGVRISHRDIPGNPNSEKEFRVPYSHLLDREKHDVLASADKIYEHAHEPKKYLLLTIIGHDYRHDDKEIQIVNEALAKELK